MFPLMLTFWLGAVGADCTSTHVVLNRGGRETVFPSQNPWVIDGVFGGSAVYTTYNLTKWREKHPKLVWTYVIAGTVAHTWAAVHNTQVARRMK